MEDNDYFTIGFYDEKYKKDLGIMGSKSGRNLDINNIDNSSILQSEIDRFYKKEPIHRMYIGEVIDIIDKRV